MNIFELGIFVIHCVVAYYTGRYLAGEMGIVGWVIGALSGFLLSLSMFYGLSKYFERRAEQRSKPKRKGSDG